MLYLLNGGMEIRVVELTGAVHVSYSMSLEYFSVNVCLFTNCLEVSLAPVQL